jgi:DNA-binding NtrC family response regulator
MQASHDDLRASFDGDALAADPTVELTAEHGARAWFVEAGATSEPALRRLLSGERIVIGSGVGSDMRILDRAVSGRHCAVGVEDGHPVVRDLGSKNGVFVGGARVETARLHAGSSFVVGRAVVAVSAGLGGTDATPPAVVEVPGVVGRSSAMQEVLREVRRLAAVKGPVLLRGETGTGKDVLARALHSLGPRRGRPFVPLNVGTLPRELADAELFGHERGAFTGAHAHRAGAFEQAHGGTLLLDEIAELVPELQVKLLRVLEDGEIRPLGGRAAQRVDVRVVSATWAPLHRRVAEGRFRQDLFQRLSVFVIDVPPLRERRCDLPLLCQRFLRDLEPEVGHREVSAGALAKLAAYGWPGNIRELRNVLYRAALSAESSRISTQHVAASLDKAVAPQRVRVSVEQAREILERHAGNVSAAARQLGLARSTFRDLMSARTRR